MPPSISASLAEESIAETARSSSPELRICRPFSSRTARNVKKLCPELMVVPGAAIVLDRGQFILFLHVLSFTSDCFCIHRVVRAFLIEEQKIVKKVLAEKMKKAKTDA